MSSDMQDLEKEFKDLEKFGTAGDLDDLEQETGLKVGPSDRVTGRSMGPKFRALPMSIAAAALVAFSGIVWFAYSDGVTKVAEDRVPLLKLAHASKIIPDDPGGLKVPHQDKLVYNHLEGGKDDARVERLLPPVETPIKPPVPTKQASVEKTTPPIPSITAPMKPKEKSDEPLVINPNAVKSGEKTTVATAKAPVPKASPVASVVTETNIKQDIPVLKPSSNTKMTSETVTMDKHVAAIETERKKDVKVPAPVVVREKAPVKPVVQKNTQVAIATTKAINSKRDWRVQLGAVSSHRKAVSEYNRQQKKNADLLKNKALEVHEVDVKGKKYFRIRLGPFASAKEARKLCASLKNRKVDCIPVAPGK